MARRSYLQRIAEPLRAGDPALFALPHPSPGERRPAAELPTSRPAAPPPAPALHRGAAVAADVDAVVAPTADRAAPSPDAIVSAHPIAPAAPRAGSAPAWPAARPLEAVGKREALRAARAQPRAPEPSPALAPAAALATASPERALEGRTAATAASPGSVAVPARPAATMPASAETSAPRTISVARDPEVFPGIRPPAPTAMPQSDPPPPRIHIGIVEVRSAAPPPARAPQPAAAAPRADAAPIARGYAWRFGLLQG
jgi:ribonuclease E